MFSSLADLVKEAVRHQYGQVKNSKLKLLAESLPEVIQQSKAKNTKIKYFRGFERYRNWTIEFNEVTVLPASSVHITLLILQLIQDNVSCSIIDEVLYGIKWVHNICGFTDPCDSSIVSAVIEAARRLLSVPVRKKESATPEIMLSLFRQYGRPDANLSDLRLLALCTLGYAGFLRFSELELPRWRLGGCSRDRNSGVASPTIYSRYAKFQVIIIIHFFTN